MRRSRSSVCIEVARALVKLQSAAKQYTADPLSALSATELGLRAEEYVKAIERAQRYPLLDGVQNV